MKTSSIDNRYMEFRLGGQLYAIPLLSVKEVISKPEITMVPNMPSYFEGMINLRGQILGVFNIRKRLSAKQQEANSKFKDVIIVIEQQGVSVGMIVDEVTRVLHANPETIGPAPLKEDDPARRFVSEVIRTAQGLVITILVGTLLDLDKYKAIARVA